MDDRFLKLTLSLGRLQKLIQKIKAEGMGRVDLKASHTVVLCQLLDCPGGLHFAELVEKCELDQALISRVLGELTRAGLVQKDGLPGRYNAVYALTGEGFACAGRVASVVAAFRDRAVQDISPNELAVFYSVLDRLADNLENALDSGPDLFAPLDRKN